MGHIKVLNAESTCAGGAVLGRLWKLLSLAADWPARAAGEEAGADEAKVRTQTS